jgi:hypothetical protein
MEHGKRALEYMVTKHPTMFVRLVASLIPRHFEFEPKHPYADLTDEELMQRIREIDAATVDRSRHHAAVSPWANGYAAWADADRDV